MSGEPYCVQCCLLFWQLVPPQLYSWQHSRQAARSSQQLLTQQLWHALKQPPVATQLPSSSHTELHGGCPGQVLDPGPHFMQSPAQEGQPVAKALVVRLKAAKKAINTFRMVRANSLPVIFEVTCKILPQ
jgi:hypothetical protein